MTKHADQIDVANMSLGGEGSDDRNCGRTNQDPIHRAICRSVAAGVSYAVAAGNESVDSATEIPSSYDEVITVSSLTDYDGQPGGLSTTPPCEDAVDPDDSFTALFSNFDADVDLIAPGVCVPSTFPGSDYALGSGTSGSSPHVAGAAALYKAKHPKTRPARVKAALLANGSFDWNNSNDPDGIKEPLLNVAGL